PMNPHDPPDENPPSFFVSTAISGGRRSFHFPCQSRSVLGFGSFEFPEGDVAVRLDGGSH
ncbi:hypothetical protein, partial [Paraburkholderia sp. BR10954]|uniref:hypothetical protein n=1 Tax=Paraburkholderia sp. BR10954 TaxID=3236995 RepID=UPI0034D1575E